MTGDARADGIDTRLHHAIRNGQPTTTAASNATALVNDITCHTRGHSNHVGAGGCARRACTIAITRGASVRGARGSGRLQRPRQWIERIEVHTAGRVQSPRTPFSRATGIRPSLSSAALSAFAAAMNVGLDLADGNTEALGNFLVAQVIEMKQHDGHALMRGRLLSARSSARSSRVQSPVQGPGSGPGSPGVHGLESSRPSSLKKRQRFRYLDRWFRHSFVVTVFSQPGAEGCCRPARTVRTLSRTPSAPRLRPPWIAQQAHGRRIDHVLVFQKKRLERPGVGHACSAGELSLPDKHSRG